MPIASTTLSDGRVLQVMSPANHKVKDVEAALAEWREDEERMMRWGTRDSVKAQMLEWAAEEHRTIERVKSAAQKREAGA